MIKILHKIFIPNVKKCHRPHAFRHKWLKFYSLALLSHVVLSVSFYSGPGILSENTATMARNIIQITNTERQKNDLIVLRENPALTQAAQDKLNDMFTNNYWDHFSPTDKKPWDFIVANNYTYAFAGENLAKGYIDSKSTVDAWMNSKTHKDNLLNNRYQEIGVAVGTGQINGKPTTLVVQMFGTPSGTMIAGSEGETFVLGTKESKYSFDSSYFAVLERAPYILIWLLIFGLILFDGAMLRRCGLHKSKKHLFEFRAALLINAIALVFLTANVVAIA